MHREFFAVDRLTIAWVDVETTGIEQQDEIVEAALYLGTLVGAHGAHGEYFDATWIQSPEWICTLQISRAMLAEVADARLAARVFYALTERWSERKPTQ